MSVTFFEKEVKSLLFEYTYQVTYPSIAPDKRRAFFMVKKMLPEYIFDTIKMENNPLTFPEVQTLMDGITVGGHKITDVQQVLNIKESWLLLLDLLKKNTFAVTKEMFHAIHALIAREEALEWGRFRSGSVSIAGTKHYKAPPYYDLDSIFDKELDRIVSIENPVEQAICIFLWGSLHQFYWDGNRRTARLMSNGILVESGYGVFNIRKEDIFDFNARMVDFYETQEADTIMQFLAEKCVIYIQY